MESFLYTSSPSRVLFGFGTVNNLSSEIERLQLTSLLILSTPQQEQDARGISALIPQHTGGFFARATMHTPLHITEEAISVIKTKSIDGLVSIGGGSTTGLGKAISIRTGLPHICIPTTYAGSEMTSILGETDQGSKKTQKDPRILPCTVIYDVDLTMTLPPQLSITSGINAMAHAVEALYAPDTNPVIRLLAREGIFSLARGLPMLRNDPKNRQARSKALLGAWLCGICLESTTMSLHHKLCHTLGGTFNTPHAETHTILLPHVVAYNARAAPEAMESLAEVLPYGDGDAVEALNEFLYAVGVGRALREYGFDESKIDRTISIISEAKFNNPRPIDPVVLRKLLLRACRGESAVVEV